MTPSSSPGPRVLADRAAVIGGRMRGSTPGTSSCARGLQSCGKSDGRSRRPALGLRGTARRWRWPSGCSALPARRSTHPHPLLGRSRAALRSSWATLRRSRPPVAPCRRSVPAVPRSVWLVRRAAPARRAAGSEPGLSCSRWDRRNGARERTKSGKSSPSPRYRRACPRTELAHRRWSGTG